MTPQQVIESIQALADVVKANSGLMGSEHTARMANEKIRELIPLLPNEPVNSENNEFICVKVGKYHYHLKKL